MAKKKREIRRFGASNARQYFEDLGFAARTNPTGNTIYDIADAAVESGEKRETVISAALALACGIVDLKYGDSKRIAELTEEKEHHRKVAEEYREQVVVNRRLLDEIRNFPVRTFSFDEACKFFSDFSSPGNQIDYTDGSQPDAVAKLGDAINAGLASKKFHPHTVLNAATAVRNGWEAAKIAGPVLEENMKLKASNGRLKELVDTTAEEASRLKQEIEDFKRNRELERKHSDSEVDGLREKLKSPSPADQLDREFAEAVAGIEESAGGKECGEVAFTMTLEIKKHSTQGPGGWLHPDFVVGFFKQSLVQKVRNQETSETKPGESDPVRERMARAKSVDREFRDAIEKLNGMADDYDEGDPIIATQFSVIKSSAQTESPGVFLHPDHAIEKFKKTLTAAVSGELAARMKANGKAKPSKPDKYKVILAPGESRCLDPDQYQYCHDLKCHPGSFRAILSGAKTAEFRKMDRDYQVGDYIILMEYRESSEYSGDKCWVEITHITDGCQFGIPDGYGMLSVKLIPPGS